jgi:hypothetical protein
MIAAAVLQINWQSVLYVGSGDDGGLSPQNRLEPTGRQIFLKRSCALQR